MNWHLVFLPSDTKINTNTKTNTSTNIVTNIFISDSTGHHRWLWYRQRVLGTCFCLPKSCHYVFVWFQAGTKSCKKSSFCCISWDWLPRASWILWMEQSLGAAPCERYVEVLWECQCCLLSWLKRKVPLCLLIICRLNLMAIVWDFRYLTKHNLYSWNFDLAMYPFIAAAT